MKHLALMLATASLLAACAAPSRRPSDEGPHDARVFTGRIDSVAGAAAIRTGSGAYLREQPCDSTASPAPELQRLPTFERSR